MPEFFAKLAVSAVLAGLIKGGVALADHSIAWWAAALISLVVVFGGLAGHHQLRGLVDVIRHLTDLKRQGDDERGAARAAGTWVGTWQDVADPDIPDSASTLAGAIDYAFNPADGDGAQEALLVDSVLNAMRFIEDQPCTCDDQGDPCERCAALGRYKNERTER